MKIKTNELSGRTLDRAVAKCEGKYVTTIADHTIAWDDASQEYFRRRHAHLGVWIVLGAPGVVEALPSYSTDWAQGGPIVDRNRISIIDETVNFRAGMCNAGGECIGRGVGSTPLIAAMRCYVASKLGDEVELTEEPLQ